jgi:hypothetical protein
MSKIVHFLSDVLSDDKKKQAFQSDPEGVMDEAGLTDEQKAVIKSRHPQAVSAMIASEISGDAGHRNAPW